MQNYLGQEIPVTHQGVKGGNYLRPNDAEAKILNQRADMDFMNNAVANIGAGNAALIPSTKPSTQSESGGLGWLQNLLGGLSGAGTDESTNLQVGGNQYGQQKKGTFGDLVDLFKSLATAAMGQQANMYGTAGGTLNSMIGERGNLMRTNAATNLSNRDLGDFFKAAGALNPKLSGITGSTAALQNVDDLGKGLPVDTFFNQGLGNTGVQGLFGSSQEAPPPPPRMRPPETSDQASKRLMAGSGTKRFNPYDYPAIPTGAMV